MCRARVVGLGELSGEPKQQAEENGQRGLGDGGGVPTPITTPGTTAKIGALKMGQNHHTTSPSPNRAITAALRPSSLPHGPSPNFTGPRLHWFANTVEVGPCATA